MTRSAIAFRAASKVTQRKGATITVPKPTGTAAGDVLVVAVAARGGVTIAAPLGWTPIVSRLSGDLRTSTFAHAAGGSEPASYRFTLSAKTSAAAVMSSYLGAILPVTTSDGGTGSGATITAPSVSPATGGVLVGAFGIATGATIDPPAGMLETLQAILGTGKAKASVEMADQVVPAGASGSRSALAAKGAPNAGLVLVLIPA